MRLFFLYFDYFLLQNGLKIWLKREINLINSRSLIRLDELGTVLI